MRLPPAICSGFETGAHYTVALLFNGNNVNTTTAVDLTSITGGALANHQATPAAPEAPPAPTALQSLNLYHTQVSDRPGHRRLDRNGSLYLATADIREDALLTSSIPAPRGRLSVEGTAKYRGGSSQYLWNVASGTTCLWEGTLHATLRKRFRDECRYKRYSSAVSRGQRTPI